MNILWTGAAGYIAAHGARKLRLAGHTLFGIDFFPVADKQSFERCYTGDCGNKMLVKHICQSYGIECIVHAAGSNDLPRWERDPIKLYCNDFVATMFLLSAALEHNVKKVLFFSTTQVYNMPSGRRAREEDIPDPQNTYGRVKYAVEHLLSSFSDSHSLRFIILRVSDILGMNPHVHATSTGNSLVELLMQTHNREAAPKGSGEDTADQRNRYHEIFDRPYDFVHVDDVADAIVAAVSKLNYTTENTIYNIASNQSIGIGEFCERVATIVHQELRKPLCVMKPVSPSNRIDIYHAQRELNWHLQQPSLGYMISSTVDWLRKHGR